MPTDCNLLLKLPHRWEDKQQHTGTQEEQQKEEKHAAYTLNKHNYGIWFHHSCINIKAKRKLTKIISFSPTCALR